MFTGHAIKFHGFDKYECVIFSPDKMLLEVFLSDDDADSEDGENVLHKPFIDEVRTMTDGELQRPFRLTRGETF